VCGLVGVKSLNPTDAAPKNAAEVAYHLLSRLQHRGQDGAGLTVLDPRGRFETARGLGLIRDALKDYPTLEPGSVAVAHTRYATTGTGGVGELQPFVKGSPKVALAHNGNIVNTEELAERHQLKLETASDLDVLQQIYLEAAKVSFVHAVQTIYDEFNGSYAVVGVEDNGTLFGFRDPFGIRPLFFGKNKDVAVLSSETCALAPLQLEIEEIAPGEWIRVTDKGIERGRLVSKKNPTEKERFCMFEVVYFSSAQSEIRKQSVYRLRFQLGARLAQEIMHTLPAGSLPTDFFDFVVPVPETSRTAAIAVAETLRVPYREYLVKNPYVPRTFILGSQDLRMKALRSKLGLIGPEIKGQRILLVDDSVVRGNTSRLMALGLFEAGATSVSMATTCPPIRNGCFYGIDFPDPAELVATGKDPKAVAEALGITSMYYISQRGLEAALGTDKLCTACLTGDYPTRDASFERFLQARQGQRADHEKQRLEKGN
jgi:amidophosphoribosyltransferase